MKKLIIFTWLCCSLYVFSKEEEIQMNELKAVGNYTIIEILFVEENYPEIEEMVKEYDKNSFNYNYFMGRLEYKKGNKKEALDYLNEALKSDSNNIELRMTLLKIYLTDRTYEENVKKEFSFFDAAQLSPEEKIKVDKLKEVYLESKKMKISHFVDTTMTYDSNIDFDVEKNSELYNTATYTLYGTKILKKGIFRTQNSIGGKLTLSNDGESGIILNLGGEFFDKYKGLDYGIPLYIQYNSISNDGDFKLISGLNHKRNIKEKQDLNAGVQIVLINNDNYKGTDLSLYGKYTFSKKINYAVDGKLLTSLYDEDTYQKNSLTLSFMGDKVLNDKYYVYGKYTYEYVLSDYEISGEKRKDMINSLKLGYEQGIWKENMKLSADYTISYDDTNYEGYSSSKNLINTSLKWEF